MILQTLACLSLLAALAALPRLVRGPTAADRIMALQFAGTGIVATLVILGAAEDAAAYFDLALVFACLAALIGVAFVALRRGMMLK
ncbi:pH regulation protein F [Meridianimarinicoccus roseus]|jgi:multicomponent Na+:H+ antiporter subunit F|uniref:pH regulation protein F n=1 Tax=Meridianimarinicoccus roseus TaxID=2072018 RepID=A0A2V2L6W9_9RHOB|nr:monovalent cation/H+ antiporter complex subunit F [Meridianimarinicoccus roseus]PWR01102.1 pH regulation protein F [Meridianimarinicoccus roseus]